MNLVRLSAQDRFLSFMENIGISLTSSQQSTGTSIAGSQKYQALDVDCKMMVSESDNMAASEIYKMAQAGVARPMKFSL